MTPNDTFSPLVSIITPCYNCAGTLEKTITSVLNQTYCNWELLITDDNSTDESVKIAKVAAGRDDRIKLYKSVKNSGAGAARNNSIKEANGKYIAFLDADDLWHKDKLHKQIHFMEKNSYNFTYTYYQKLTNGNLGSVITAPAEISYDELLKSNVIGCLTAVYNSDVFGKVYMPTIRKRQDMALWLKLLELTPKAYCLPENLAIYNTATGMTQNKLSSAKAQWQLYRHTLQLPLSFSVRCMLEYSMKGFLKKLK